MNDIIPPSARQEPRNTLSQTVDLTSSQEARGVGMQVYAPQKRNPSSHSSLLFLGIVFALCSGFILKELPRIPWWVYLLIASGFLLFFLRRLLLSWGQQWWYSVQTSVQEHRMREMDKTAALVVEEPYVSRIPVPSVLPETHFFILQQGGVPSSAIFPHLLTIESSGKVGGLPQRSRAFVTLLEELCSRQLLTTLFVTTTTSFVSLCQIYPTCTFVGHPQARGLLPHTLQHQFFALECLEDVEELYTTRIMRENNHVYILLLSTYQDEMQAASMLARVLEVLAWYVQDRDCLFALDAAEQLFPLDLKDGYFTDQRTAVVLYQALLSLLISPHAIGLRTLFSTSSGDDLASEVFALFDHILVNTPLPSSTQEQEAFTRLCALLGLLPENLAHLREGYAMLVTLTDDTRAVRPLMLRQHRTLHMPSPPAVTTAPFLAAPVAHASLPQPHEKLTQEVTPTHPLFTLDSPSETELARIQLLCYLQVHKPHYYQEAFLLQAAEKFESLYPLFTVLNLMVILAQEQCLFTKRSVQPYMQWVEQMEEPRKRTYADETRALLAQYWFQRQPSGQSVVPAHPTTPGIQQHLDVPILVESQSSAPHSGAADTTLEEERVFQLPLENQPLISSPSTWCLPSTSLLDSPKESVVQISPDEKRLIAQTVQETLRSFKVDAEVKQEDISIGPTIIRLGIRPTGKPEMQPDEKTGKLVPVRDKNGNIVYETRTRVSRIMALQNDLALVLEAKTIRMDAPVPGRPYIGVEIPNKNSLLVTLREVLESQEYQVAKGKSKLAVALGKDVAGVMRVGDLGRMPHLLIAGATGSGKSVIINAIVLSLITQATPDDVRLLMVDPKMVELNMYNGIPHLLSPVVTEVNKVVSLLKNAINEMERRYRLFSQMGVRNLDGYRKLRAERAAKGAHTLVNLPSIVIIIDELADLMMAAPEEVEGMICRLAQLARATGIHLVVATQRPSVDVITGLIKANIPTRISCMVSSAVDSRTIIDMGGAERLLGRGDMLYLPSDVGRPERIQGAFVADEETERLVEHWHHQALQQLEGGDGVMELQRVEPGWELKEQESDENEEDDLLKKAEEIILEKGTPSASLLMRRLRIGNSRALRLLDLLEDRGVICSVRAGKYVLADDATDDANLFSPENEGIEKRDPKEYNEVDFLHEVPFDGEDANHQTPSATPEPSSSFFPRPTDQSVKLPDTGKLVSTHAPAAVLRPAPSFPLLEQRPILATLKQIVQGNMVVLEGLSIPHNTDLMLVLATIALKSGYVSPNKVSRMLSVKSDRVYAVAEQLTEIYHLLQPHTGGNSPRQLTADRGGEYLSSILKELCSLTDTLGPSTSSDGHSV